VLTELCFPIAPSTYYAARAAARRPSKQAQRDAQLKVEIARVHAQNYGVYGARKVWLALNREGVAVARCTVERLMGELGLVGAQRGRRVRTTVSATAAARPADLVERNFNPPAPNRTWVADITYVPTWSGMVYVAFVLGAYSRRILGWRAATSMRTALVLDALEHAVGIDPSVGSVGDAYDNALAESVIGLFKTELINRADRGAPSSRSRSRPSNHRLVQPPTALRGLRRHPTRRPRNRPLQSTRRSYRGWPLNPVGLRTRRDVSNRCLAPRGRARSGARPRHPLRIERSSPCRPCRSP
jgi:putative transposase